MAVSSENDENGVLELSAAYHARRAAATGGDGRRRGIPGASDGDGKREPQIPQIPQIGDKRGERL